MGFEPPDAIKTFRTNLITVLTNTRLTGIVAELLFDGLSAFKKGSPNMNSLVGFGSVAAFIISLVRFYLGFDSLQDS